MIRSGETGEVLPFAGITRSRFNGSFASAKLSAVNQRLPDGWRMRRSAREASGKEGRSTQSPRPSPGRIVPFSRDSVGHSGGRLPGPGPRRIPRVASDLPCNGWGASPPLSQRRISELDQTSMPTMTLVNASIEDRPDDRCPAFPILSARRFRRHGVFASSRPERPG